MGHEAIQYLAIVQLVMLPQVRKRANRETVDGMAKTVERIGILAPIRVRRHGEKFVVVDGHLRVLAAKAAGLDSVPCIIEERELRDVEVTERQLIANRRREDLRPIEFAEAVDRLMRETQSTLSQVADLLGESKPTLSRHLALLNLPESIRARIESGEIAPSAAYKLTQVQDAKQQEELAAELCGGHLTRDGLNGKLTRDAMNGRAKQKRSDKARAVRKPASKVVAKLSGGRSVAFSGPELSSVAVLIAWLEELLAAAKALPDGADLAVFAQALEQSKE